MNVLLVYATNSGTTMMTAQAVSDTLTQKGHTVTMKEVRDASPDDFAAHDIVILGSPSWDFDGQEGMPHEDYMPLIEKLKTKSFEGKPFAVFGLGDSSYTHFCGAVDHLETLISDIKGTLISPSLRIDNFFSDQNKHTQAIGEWAEGIAGKLTT